MPADPIAVVRIRLDDFATEWLAAVNDLLDAVENADPIMVEGDVADAAQNVRDVMWKNATRARSDT